MQKKQRLAAYGVCRRDTGLLLVHSDPPRGGERHWTLPGGGVEHGEDPYDALVREFAEETGYDVQVLTLLGVGSLHRLGTWDGNVDLHAVAVYYEARVVGGHLRTEHAGTTDDAAWFTPEELAALPPADLGHLARTGLHLEAARPADGRPAPHAR